MPQIWANIIGVALGGAIGSLLRYCVSLCLSGTHSFLILSTFTVNIVGSFIIGIAYAYASSFDIPIAMRLFIFIGLLGGFTTFSSYSLEVVQMIRDANYWWACMYFITMNISGIIAAIGGIALATKILK